MDNQRIEYFFKKYYRKCVYMANKIVKDRQEAEDVAMRVFIQLAEKDDNQIEHKVDGWLRFWINRRAIDAWRYQKVKDKNEKRSARLQGEEEGPRILDKLEEELKTKALFAVYNEIEKLPAGQKRVIQDYLNGISPKEIRDKKGGSLQTVNNLKTKAIKNLRQILPLKIENPFLQ